MAADLGLSTESLRRWVLQAQLNAGFNATIKRELVGRTHWSTQQGARAAVFEWITVFYNRQRRHSSIGYQTPVACEEGYLVPAA